MKPLPGIRWWFGWWYLALAIGFALLGVAHIITRGAPLLIAVRFILAAGFGVLSRFELRAGKPRRR